MNRYLTELIGTFFLVLVIGLSAAHSLSMAPLIIGSTLMVMIYMGGHISGGHYNPAVTLAVYFRGKIGFIDTLYYFFFQILGGLLGSLTSLYLSGHELVVAPNMQYSLAQVFAAEVIFTFALALVVLNVATSKDHQKNSFYGVAIGMTVMGAAFVAGPISGGAFNPAVALAHNLLARQLDHLWIYMLAPSLGGVLAAFVFRLTNPSEFFSYAPNSTRDTLQDGSFETSHF